MNDTPRSLLLRAQGGNEQAWREFNALYRPLILGWLRRQGVSDQDLDDLTQDVLVVVFKQLPAFEHSGRCGAFRAWMRTVVCQRICDYWRACDQRGWVRNGSAEALHQLEDPTSDLNRQWDEEHDGYILRCLLDLVAEEFEATTLQAFRRLALDGATGAVVAAELGLSVAAVYVAKSRVLQRLRREAEGLLD